LPLRDMLTFFSSAADRAAELDLARDEDMEGSHPGPRSVSRSSGSPATGD
jgi:hypothetical protein